MKFNPVNKVEIKEKTRAFFHSQKWKDLLVFLVFIVLALGFWLLQQAKDYKMYNTVEKTPVQEKTVLNDTLTGKGKRVPVRLDGSLSPAPGYRWLGNLHIEPENVWVYGDPKLLDTLQWIKTTSLNQENIQKNVDLTLKLNLPKGLRSSVQKVRLTVDIEEYTEKKFNLPIRCRNLPENIQVRFFPSTVEIVCLLSLNQYAYMNVEDLEVSVDYTELVQNSGVNIQLTLFCKPLWLMDYRIVPETVEYLIEQKQLL